MNIPTWIPRDKLMHAAVGLAAVLAVLLVLAVAKHDIGFSLAVATTPLGLGAEGLQKFRGEGDFSLLDAAATAAPGFLAWGVLASFGPR